MSTNETAEKPEKLKQPKSSTSDVEALHKADNIAVAGFTLSIASIFTSFFTLGLMPIVGLVLSIVGRVQAKKAGRPNSLALAGIIISSIVLGLTLIVTAFFVVLALISYSQSSTCERHSEAYCAELFHEEDAPFGPDRYFRPMSNSL